MTFQEIVMGTHDVTPSERWKYLEVFNNKHLHAEFSPEIEAMDERKMGR
jgi:hypothetical protein